MKQLSIQRLIFVNCHISESVAAVFVEALSAGENSFTEIDLFKKSCGYNKWWRWSSKDQDDEHTRRWKQTISGEINKLTWSNRFKVDKNTFLHEVLGPASVKEKLDFLFWNRGVRGLSVESLSDKEKLHLVIRKFGYFWYSGIDKSLSDNEKLCYCAMGAANIYDDHHKLTSGTPSMLHSLIREIPDFFSQFIVNDGAEQQMKKR